MLLATIPIHKYWRKKFLTLLFTEMMQNSLVTWFTRIFTKIQWNFASAFWKKNYGSNMNNDAVKDTGSEWKK